MRYILLSLILFTASSYADLTGRVVAVTDGDTIKVLDNSNTQLNNEQAYMKNSELEIRQGLTYKVNDPKPFTGTALDAFDNGHKAYETNYVDGKKHGLSTHWHENGQKYFENNFVDGKHHGLSASWYKNGQKEIETNYVDGKQGLGTSWYENGKIQYQPNWFDRVKWQIYLVLRGE